ncbi:hypothetical protein MLD38_000098 [Melastoma candidum]|uniref:Uncharacterized protein n=1 Tax=Melastoma candidum TaxID=119954 RepID=A0ACB9S914_9MYRT|nr:hypothetical protein MLD38_000098 [Melastoma candidum]
MSGKEGSKREDEDGRRNYDSSMELDRKRPLQRPSQSLQCFKSSTKNSGILQVTDRTSSTNRSNLSIGSKVDSYKPPHRRIPYTHIDDRRAKGLCFWCDEKYTFGHKCANKKLFSLILEPTEEAEEQGEEILNCDESPVITLHALYGLQGDSAVANQLSCELHSIPVQKVMVANGDCIVCTDICKGFRWKM